MFLLKMKTILYHLSDNGVEVRLKAPVGLGGLNWGEKWQVTIRKGNVEDIYSGSYMQAFRKFLEYTGCVVSGGTVIDAIIHDYDAMGRIIQEYTGNG